ncbi:ABC transporter ATP-binding protein [Nocardioides mangrovicus]|uniref:ABC transporter ATP-binding protein n=1 Tax=Nocardioides mangrovicus TaxID=2478913 RepID=A0A3L8P4V9_9ACTN|nr:ATP-binding cassette domain-containing protein [Nocardioides mangrovicus]RLV50164.1 ABC transporter ATP-binding protein [Nocardioides mangrovicus]
MTRTSPALHAVTWAWPDGTVAFDRLDLQLPAGRTGLVGANGSGKTTLLRLLAGELTPQAGQVSGVEDVAHLAQDLALETEQTIAGFMGIDGVRTSLRRIEAGSVDPADYAAVGERWDVEDRARAELARAGLPRTGNITGTNVLDRRLGELSGGEVTALGLARILLARPAVVLLDEPTTHLDRQARERLTETLSTLRGTVVVVSHDPELLEGLDQIAELREGRVRWYGGGWSSYAAQVRAEQEAAEQALTSARADVRRQRADLVESEQVLARRRRYAQKMYATKREPRAVMKLRQRAAQQSAAGYTRTHQDRLDRARERLADAEQQVREDREIRVDLPDTQVPGARVVLHTEGLVLRTGRAIELELRGPERLALLGANGSGKSTLLHTVAGRLAPRSGRVDVRVPVGLLPQRLDLLDPDLSIAANLARRAPAADDNQVRARLARFLFRGDRADQHVASLSGGELFRATLAALLLADPAPQLLLLDEPTNSLDLASREALVSALACYGGALVVAGHDLAFLDQIGVERAVEL